jgi:acyl-CoA thioesterase I
MQDFLVQKRSSAYGLLRLGDKLRRGIGVLICTLGMGFSVAAPAETAPLRVAALGDSLTQGYGLAQGDGLVPQLEAWLQAAGHDVILINAGVSGDTTAGGLSRLDWTLADEPDAMMIALGGNDLLRGIDPANSRANLQAILERLQAEDLPAMLIGLPAPGNYGPEFRDAFEAMYVELAEEYGAVRYPNLLQPISDKHELGLSYGELMQDDRIHPSAAGVQAIVEALGPVVSDWLREIEAEDTGS